MHDHTMTIIESKAVGQGLTNILFVCDDGLFAVAHIENGGLAMTQSAHNSAGSAYDDRIRESRDLELLARARLRRSELARLTLAESLSPLTRRLGCKVDVPRTRCFGAGHRLLAAYDR
jgi:hypothetical protein